MEDIENLRRMATAFRSAIEDAIADGSIDEINLRRFPNGCRMYASDMLQRYLYDYGIKTLSVSGEFNDGQRYESHAWLETDDGTIIDITGDQYANGLYPLTCTTPVYVGPSDAFHDSFSTLEPLPYKPTEEALGITSDKLKADVRYELVCSQLVASA